MRREVAIDASLVFSACSRGRYHCARLLGEVSFHPLESFIFWAAARRWPRAAFRITLRSRQQVQLYPGPRQGQVLTVVQSYCGDQRDFDDRESSWGLVVSGLDARLPVSRLDTDPRLTDLIIFTTLPNATAIV